jgi:DNA (cytosine-5)-methyltransferase 1
MFRALDLFCCAGGASEGLRRAGFNVVGVDIDPQPQYPFEFHQADALTFPLDGFDFIWASPPCQAFTVAQRIRKNVHPDLVAPIRERLKLSGNLYCIENVPNAPLIEPIQLCGAMFGLQTYRHRLFECSFPIEQPEHPKHVNKNAKMGRPIADGEFIQVVGNFSNIEFARDAMQIDWMTGNTLREAIPPAYSEYIGRAAIDVLANRSFTRVNTLQTEDHTMITKGTNSQLGQFFNALNDIEEQKLDLSIEIKSIVEAAKNAGVDVRALRRAVKFARNKKREEELAIQDMLDQYLVTLGLIPNDN